MMNQFSLRSLVIPDLVALWLALLTASFFAGKEIEAASFFKILEWRISFTNIVLVAIWSVMWILFNLVLESYQNCKPNRMALKILGITFIGVAALGGSSLLIGIRLVNRGFLLFFGVTYFFLDLLLRFLHLKATSFLDPEAHYTIHTVVVGSLNAPIHPVHTISLPQSILVGYFADAPCPQWNAHYLGPIATLMEYVKENAIDQILINMPLFQIDANLRSQLAEAEAQGIEILFPVEILAEVLPLPDPLASRAHLRRIHISTWGNGQELALLAFDSGPQMGWSFLTKRFIDISLAAIAIVLLAPLFVVISIAIRISMGSPIFFIQQRLGYHRRIFHLYKFRTMITNADAMRQKLRQQNERDGAAFKMRNDPRITPLGRWLRRSNLDELPQLFNVLKGDMSLVGPRPLPLDDYAHMDRITYLRRLSVLPGITGPWQISDREKVSFEKWMEMDLEYVDHWSLKTDVVLLLKTVWSVLTGRGDK